MRGGFMRNQVRRYVLGFSLVVVLSMAVPAMAETTGGGGTDDVLSRIWGAIIQILDVVDNKLTIPPG